MSVALRLVPDETAQESTPQAPARRPGKRPMSREDTVRKANLALERMDRVNPKERRDDGDWLYDEREKLNGLLSRVVDAAKGAPFSAEESQFIEALQARRDAVVRLFSKFDFMGL